MKVVSLVDNISNDCQIKSQHGLSFYIEANNYKLLFDTGASDLFFENAQKLGVNLADIDYAVISHGHYDHGGGLKRFLTENQTAEVFIKKEAFGNFYSKKASGLEYIGLDRQLESNDRIVFASNRFFINENIELFSGVEGKNLFPPLNKSLYEKRGENAVLDSFLHEQNMIVTENGKRALFAGCAHNGIVNIIEFFEEIKQFSPDYVFAGFHLSSPLGDSEDEYIEKVAKAIGGKNIKFYTCHCTGFKAYEKLKNALGGDIYYLSAGESVIL